nr:immunoglobulin light chain junction region [Macaca mulatta]MOW27473.1 immunoglobulin light chain junction region [Macaca mulatta]MOW27597.1 immunoglobulin light chain junction region [Macaca mulatta]MOW27757.1 immunoglobulin light chain junction region [Macaca mulatta]MOW27777.1 immunoglobulin light chain junction region [Macaca mulatta]
DYYCQSCDSSLSGVVF